MSSVTGGRRYPTLNMSPLKYGNAIGASTQSSANVRPNSAPTFSYPLTQSFSQAYECTGDTTVPEEGSISKGKDETRRGNPFYSSSRRCVHSCSIFASPRQC
ncbi:unnamed protein product [Allacma fusca]|uniref:Uncharacterized protein n=1 Tax=Allacma fusca TaxID=39272 RepID=A0A8J2KXE5_9HEXA|nr:unnamed protein product [Allacma fusca]